MDKKKEIDWERIQEHYDETKNLKRTSDELAVKYNTLRRGVRQGMLKKHPFVPYQWSPEQKKAQSERKKKLYREHPEKHPNRRLANNKSKMSYPEKLVFEFLKKEGIPFEHNFYIQPYWVDFLVGDSAIEIDGKYWHEEEKDKNRDRELLKTLGKVCRFPASRIMREGPEIVAFEVLGKYFQESRVLELRERQKELIEKIEKEKISRLKKCKTCGKVISRRATHCRSCSPKTDNPDRERDLWVTECIQSGQGIKKIVDQLGMTYNGVKKVCKRLGLDYRTYKAVDPEVLKDCVKKGMVQRDIALVLDCSTGAVDYNCKKLGLEVQKIELRKVNLSESEWRELFKFHTHREISDLLGITTSNVARYRKKFKI